MSSEVVREEAAGRDFAGELLILQGGDAFGRSCPVTFEGLRIGRDPRICELVLTDPTISRVHAELHVDPSGQVRILNRSGTNLTYLNGRPVREALLSPGDRIRIGRALLIFRRG